MEGFDMNDWEVFEVSIEDGQPCKRLTYKNSEGNKHYNAWYYSPEKIYVEVWEINGSSATFMEGGLTWGEALQYEIPPYEDE